jgi:hypothetical protein
MADTYKEAKKPLEDAVRPVSDAVEKLVGDAGWTGEAAENSAPRGARTR